MNHSRLRRCEILLDYIGERDPAHRSLYQETLLFDLYARENMKSRPEWAAPLADWKDITRQYCKQGKLSHVERFWYDMELIRQNRTLAEYPAKKEKQSYYLFSYEQRDPLTGQTKTERLQLPSV